MPAWSSPRTGWGRGAPAALLPGKRRGTAAQSPPRTTGAPVFQERGCSFISRSIKAWGKRVRENRGHVLIPALIPTLWWRLLSEEAAEDSSLLNELTFKNVEKKKRSPKCHKLPSLDLRKLPPPKLWCSLWHKNLGTFHIWMAFSMYKM